MGDTPIFDSMNTSREPEPVDNTPRPKVVAATAGAGVGSALATITVWIVNATTNVVVPEGVELALGIVLTTGLAFVGGYWKRG